jgi:hypothetical protein
MSKPRDWALDALDALAYAQSKLDAVIALGGKDPSMNMFPDLAHQQVGAYLRGDAGPEILCPARPHPTS